MTSHRFDDLARALVAADRPTTRRALLRAVGLGGAAIATGTARPAVTAAQEETPAGAVPAGPAPTLGGPTLEDLAFALEYDTEKMFRFVADEVAYEPYAGALRGATGTLWGMAGNSVDQALLLAALLAQAMLPVRFAIGELDDRAAAQIEDATRIDPRQARTRAARVLLPADRAASWSGDGPWPRSPEIDGLLAVARDHLTDGLRTIEDGLAAAGVVLPAASAGLPDRERRQHVWVQYADGPNWIDLDPSVPGAEPGAAPVVAVETVAELPADLYHAVIWRVLAEVVTGGQPTRTEMLVHQARSADLVGESPTLLHPSAEWLGISSAITGTQGYVPTLLVGEQIVEGLQISLNSDGGVLGALGEATEVEGQALAEWLEVDVLVPDQPVRTAVRTLFDRIAPDERAAGTFDLAALPPIERVEIEELGQVFIPMAAATTFAVVSHLLPWGYFERDTGVVDEQADLAAVAFGLHYLRDIVRLDRVADLGHHFYADEPNVVAFSAAPGATQDGDGERERVSVALDLFHRHHASLPLDGESRAAHPGVVAGIIDHAAERMAVEGSISLMPNDPLAEVAGVGLVFDAARREGIPLRTMVPGQSASELDLVVAARGLIDEALTAGRIVVVPERSVTLNGRPRSGWWEIDPATGQTADRMDDGRGQDLAEYAIMIHHLVSKVACAIALGYAIAAIAQGAYKDATAAAAVGAGQCALAAAH